MHLFLYRYILYMNIIPQNNNVLCKLAISKQKTLDSGFTYESNDINQWQIVEISKNVEKDFKFSIGDIVLVSSTGTLVNNDGKELYLFNAKNIVAKVED